MSPTENTLTNNQEVEILRVFKKHRIFIPEEKKEWLLFNIESDWHEWKLDQEKTTSSKQDILAEIKRLRNAIKNIGPGAGQTLGLSIENSGAVKQIDRTGLHRLLIGSLVDNMQPEDEHVLCDIVSIAFSVLQEACDEALKTGGSVMLEGMPEEMRAIDWYSTKAGRPKKWADIQLVRDLAFRYRYGTKKRPTETPYGPFDDFVACIFNIIQPRRERVNFRKLIHTALK